MRRVVFGVFLCILALILLQLQQPLFGLPLFIYGIILMYGGKWPKGPR